MRIYCFKIEFIKSIVPENKIRYGYTMADNLNEAFQNITLVNNAENNIQSLEIYPGRKNISLCYVNERAFQKLLSEDTKCSNTDEDK